MVLLERTVTSGAFANVHEIAPDGSVVAISDVIS